MRTATVAGPVAATRADDLAVGAMGSPRPYLALETPTPLTDAETEMAYDEGLAQRVREALSDRRGLSEKKMFGGLCFLVNGNMACGIVRDELMVRIGPAAYDHALAEPEAREMDFTGRAPKGFVYVESDALQDDVVLEKWAERGASFAETLPGK